jgi:hypothetical protein
MSDTLGPGDLILCVNAAPNHVTGEPVPLVAGETYRVFDLWEFACPCGRSDALVDVGLGFAWCQSRFRKLPKPKARERVRRTATPKKLDVVDLWYDRRHSSATFPFVVTPDARQRIWVPISGRCCRRSG